MSLFSNLADALNSSVFAAFGDDENIAITDTGGGISNVPAVYLHTDATGSTEAFLCRESDLSAFPSPTSTITRLADGVTYSIANAHREDGDWLRIDVRRRG